MSIIRSLQISFSCIGYESIFFNSYRKISALVCAHKSEVDGTPFFTAFFAVFVKCF